MMNILLKVLFLFSALTLSGLIHRKESILDTTLEEASFLAPRALTTDITDRNYLALLSAPLDRQNPNPSRQYVHDDTSGAGSTIFIIDSGFNVVALPYEFCTASGRWIEYYLVSRDVRSTPLTDDQIAKGIHFPPDNFDDVGGIGQDNLIHGHGTQVAVIDGGCLSGVAPRANLVLIKAADIKLGPDGHPYSNDQFQFLPEALIAGLEFVLARLEDPEKTPIPRGKAIVSISFGIPIDEIMVIYTELEYKAFLSCLLDTVNQLDQRGVTVVFASGNDGKGRGQEDSGSAIVPDETPHYTNENFPQTLATSDETTILVGGTDEFGRLRPQTSPGRDDCPITIYAASRLPGYDFATGERDAILYGTSFSAPQVAGLAAYLLALPSESYRFQYNAQDLSNNTVGMRVKKRLVELSYQRVTDGNKLAAPPNEFGYTIPTVVNVAYNGAYGAQAT